MNNVNITGRLTNDIELRTTQSGSVVCSFTVAVDHPAVKDRTDFIDCVAWRRKAEFLSKYFRKGDGIEITGILTTRRYEDKNKSLHKVTEVVCEQVTFPKGKKFSDDNSKDNDSFEEIENIEKFDVASLDDSQIPYSESKDVPF